MSATVRPRRSQGWSTPGDRWRQKHPGESSLLVAKTNAQVAALNRAARQRLRAAGELAAEDTGSVAAVTLSDQPYALDLAEGDRIRFLVRHDPLGIVNGTEGRLERIDRALDGELRLHARIGEPSGGGRLVTFTPADLADEAGRVRLAHAYATTCYGSQGLTTEAAFVLADAAMDRHDIHVAASRARETTQLFVDRRALDARVEAERLLGDRERAVEAQERSDALAAALARSGVKRTTLDYLTPAQRQALVDRSHRLHRDPRQPIVERPPERSNDRDRERSVSEPSVNGQLPPGLHRRTPLGDGTAAKPDAPGPLRRRTRSKGLFLE